MTQSTIFGPRGALKAAALLSLGLVLAALTIYICGRIRAGHEVDQALAKSRLAAQQSLNLRFQRLQLMSGAMAGDSSFVGYVLEASSVSNDPFGSSQGGSGSVSSSVKDLLTERQTQVRFDFGMVLDPNGGVIAATGDGQGDLSTDPLFAASMKAHGAHTNYWLRNGKLYQAVVTPLANHDQQVGFLVLALAVDQVELNAMKQDSGSEHLVFDTVSGGYMPVAGTLTSDDMADLGKQLQTRGTLPKIAFNLSFGGNRWLAYAAPLSSEGDNGVMLTLASYQQTMDETYIVLLALLAEVLLLGFLAVAADFWQARRSPVWPTRPKT